MDFYAVLDQVVALLRQRGRASYRALKVQFQLDDEQLEALKEELIDIQAVAVDQDGKMLVWTGDGDPPVSRSTFAVSSAHSPSPHAPSPATYTPPHLTERILAEQAAMESRGAAAPAKRSFYRAWHLTSSPKRFVSSPRIIITSRASSSRKTKTVFKILTCPNPLTTPHSIPIY